MGSGYLVSEVEFKMRVLASQAVWLNAVQLQVVQDLKGGFLFLFHISLTLTENLAYCLLILPSFFGTSSSEFWKVLSQVKVLRDPRMRFSLEICRYVLGCLKGCGKYLKWIVSQIFISQFFNFTIGLINIVKSKKAVRDNSISFDLILLIYMINHVWNDNLRFNVMFMSKYCVNFVVHDDSSLCHKWNKFVRFQKVSNTCFCCQCIICINASCLKKCEYAIITIKIFFDFK